MAGEVDNVARTLTVRSAEAAVQSVLDRLALSHADYSEWDEAVRNLYGPVNTVFFIENYEVATQTAALFDTAYVLDEDFRPIEAVRLGMQVDLPLDEAFSPAVAELFDGLPDDGRTMETRKGIVSGAWGPTLVAVGPIVPSSRGFEKPPERSRYLLVGKAFGKAAVGALADEFVLSGLRLVDADESVEEKLDLVDPAGRTIAALTWPPAQMGTQAYADLSPAVIMMLSLVGATIVALIVIAYRSVVDIKRSEDQARHAAAHDALSGLPNRAELLRRTADVIARVRRPGAGAGGALIFLDLDGFKQVNDAYGHNTGDRLLRTVAVGFHTVCGDRLVARIGGDEFAVLMVDDDPMAAAMELGRLVIRYITRPFEIDGRAISVGTSLGVAVIDETVTTAEEALRRADIAMYQAKQRGRNRICAYDESIDVARDERMAIAAELRQALRSGNLDIAYQPIFDAASRRVVGAEALLRWPRPGPAIPPDVFIPIAEETGLIDELGIWTLRQACLDAREWPGIRLAVNVSPAQFHSNFDRVLASVLDEVDFAPERLELEVTETYLVGNPTQARQSISAIRDLGIAVALDDFGSGFSSIGYLRSFTFDKLKLDRSLIAGIASDQRVQRFVQATIAMAEALDLEVVAEGVETEDEASLLRLAGCRVFQGYHLARPCSAAEFTTYLRTGESPPGARAAAEA